MADSSKDREQRKADLLVQSALLREELDAEVRSIVQIPDVLSKGAEFVKKAKGFNKKPLLLGAAVVALWMLRPRHVVSFCVTAALVFKLWRRYGDVAMPVINFLIKHVKKN